MFYDENLINIWECILLQFLLLPDGKKHLPAQKMFTSRGEKLLPAQKYLSESYAVDAVGSTSSKLEIFCLALLFHKKVMVDIWLFDEKSIDSYNTKKYLMK